MKLNFLEILASAETGYFYKSTKQVRIVLLLGIIMYSLFGVLDVFMLPHTFHFAWFIRYAIMLPLPVFFYFFSFTKMFNKFGDFWLTCIVLAGQIGIMLMIYNAQTSEGAYLGYYAGLIIVNLWAVIMLRLSLPGIILISTLNVILYDILALGFQKLQLYPVSSYQFSCLINNNFFLISTAMLAIVGSYQLSTYKKKMLEHNRMLSAEKKELAKAKKKAEESERLKSAFLANMSHEIRTPMNAILGFGELLKSPSITQFQKDNYLNIIQDKGNHLMQLINDIIDFSRIEANYITIDPKPLNLNLLFDELLLTYQQVLITEKKSESVLLYFNKSLRNTNSYIMADENRLKQILSNLVDNAIKFTAKGEIHAGYELTKNNLLQFYVKDTGVGIPQDMKSLIFERFRQVGDNPYSFQRGTGLGLSIVKSLVELLGGKIWLESELNNGSQFYFTLPYHPVAARNIADESIIPKEEDLDWEGKTILVAEDDDINYLYLEEILKYTRATLLRAKDGKETLDIALGPRKIHLLLLDIKMPLLNGFEAAKQIKLINKDLPIIVQTAYAMEDDRKRAFAANCNEYVSKPIERSRLLLLLSKYLN